MMQTLGLIFETTYGSRYRTQLRIFYLSWIKMEQTARGTLVFLGIPCGTNDSGDRQSNDEDYSMEISTEKNEVSQVPSQAHNETTPNRRRGAPSFP